MNTTLRSRHCPSGDVIPSKSRRSNATSYLIGIVACLFDARMNETNHSESESLIYSPIETDDEFFPQTMPSGICLIMSNTRSELICFLKCKWSFVLKIRIPVLTIHRNDVCIQSDLHRSMFHLVLDIDSWNHTSNIETCLPWWFPQKAFQRISVQCADGPHSWRFDCICRAVMINLGLLESFVCKEINSKRVSNKATVLLRSSHCIVEKF